MMTDSKGNSLGYEPRSPRGRWLRFVLRTAVYTAIGGLLVVGVWAYRSERVRAKVRTLYWQRQCLAYEDLPDSVVFEECAPPAGSDSIVTGSAGRPPTVERSKPCPAWAALAFDVGRLGRDNHALFLHERVSAAGTRRLVVVQCHGSGPYRSDSSLGPVRVWSVVAVAVRPGSITHWPSATAVVDTCIGGFENERIRIYAGQADPRDPSRFSIRYELDGHSGIINGVLTDDAQITLSLDDARSDEVLQAVNYWEKRHQADERAARFFAQRKQHR